jgi:hypothetical protein
MTREHERDSTTTALPTPQHPRSNRRNSILALASEESPIDNVRQDGFIRHFGESLESRRRQWEQRTRERTIQHSDNIPSPTRDEPPLTSMTHRRGILKGHKERKY